MRELANHHDALALLAELGASHWLIRHHELVVEAAIELVGGLTVPVDRRAVTIGAALHDAGKILHPEEQRVPGNRHEAVGRQLLLDHGVAPELARFCVTHAAWEGEALEDQLVALADKLWKGVRHEILERVVVERVALLSGVESWDAYVRVDAICESIAAAGDDRLARSAL